MSKGAKRPFRLGYTVSLCADRKIAVSGGRDNTIRVWDLEHYTELALIPLPFVRTVALENKQIISGASTGEISFFTLSS